jgi:hypothetical protein
MAAHHYLIRALYAEISRIRCYLATGDINLAKQRLLDDLPAFRNNVERLIRAWLGTHPAVFLHKNTTTENVDRFLHVMAWLNHDDLRRNPLAVFRIIDDLRADFWQAEVVEDRYDDNPVGHLFGQITRRPVETFEDRLNRLTGNLNYNEVLIENFQRLEGFEWELRTMRLSSFEEWRRLIDDDQLRQHGLGIIYDEDVLARVS